MKLLWMLVLALMLSSCATPTDSNSVTLMSSRIQTIEEHIRQLQNAPLTPNKRDAVVVKKENEKNVIEIPINVKLLINVEEIRNVK